MTTLKAFNRLGLLFEPFQGEAILLLRPGVLRRAKLSNAFGVPTSQRISLQLKTLSLVIGDLNLHPEQCGRESFPLGVSH